MGKSKKIVDAEKDNKEFQDFLMEIKGQIKKVAEVEGMDFKDKISAFYDDRKLEYVVIAEGEKYDYRFATEIGLITMKDQIGKMVDAIFGIAKMKEPEKAEQTVVNSTENGAVTSNVTAEVIESLKILDTYKDMAAIVVTNLLTEVLDIFSTKLEVKNSHNFSAEAVAPGLRLHIDVYTGSYVNKKFLNNESIVENYIRFQLIYSPKLAAIEGNLQTQIILETRKTNLARMLAALNNQIVKMLPDMSVSQEVLNIYCVRLEMLRNFYEQSRKDIEVLINEYLPVKTLRGAAPNMEDSNGQRELMEKRWIMLETVRRRNA